MISPAKDRYASRTDRSAGIVARHDPVVYGEGRYADALSPEQVQAYDRDGFLMLENLLPPAEVGALIAEITRMSRDPAIVRREESITEPGSNAVRSIFMVHQLSPLIGAPGARPAAHQRGAADPRLGGLHPSIARAT